MKTDVRSDLALLILRLGAGAMMLTHGIPKIMRFFSGNEIKFADPFGLGPEISLAMAAFAEGICSILVILGFKTRLASIPIILTMLTAAFYAHWDDPFGRKELPLLFCVVFISLLLTGGGAYSLDNLKKR
ncbi:DoxX family protein [Algoriphagus aestuariicola]|jgi:putative oxidoreductase|uniref:DoxX family protein n=1 Tax=Algoriphagus aestuariicola TaxID=1852016 RepID=A0ABS3BRC6_9BACT|nr:DoxX family protein [Algoriphagus aestuariicola]MBN7801850.1 DoxX family protein [Algoriphagus aestuariicola]